jgi:hypothetical protein
MVTDEEYTRHRDQPPRFALAHLASGLPSSESEDIELAELAEFDMDDAVEVEDDGSGDSLAAPGDPVSVIDDAVDPLSLRGAGFFLGGNGMVFSFVVCFQQVSHRMSVCTS